MSIAIAIGSKDQVHRATGALFLLRIFYVFEQAGPIPIPVALLNAPAARNSHPSSIATARVQPADARSIFTGKHDTVKPVDGSCSRLCSFSMWQ